MSLFSQIFYLLKTTFAEWQEDKASRLAAALAYYTIFSMAPLVIIVLGIIGFVFGQDLAGNYLIEQVQSLVGQHGAELVQSIIENASQPSTSIIATLIGLGTLLFGATGVFAQLQDALNTVWGVTPRPDKGIIKIIETRFTSLTIVLGIGFLLLVSLIISAVLSALNGLVFSGLPLGQAINIVVSFGVITFLFAMIYKILPDVKIQWSDVWIGSAVTALLFVFGKFLLGFYLGNQSFGSTYGAAGSILILLLWVYYSAQIFLFGAEFTQVYAKRYGSRIMPDEDAIPLTEEMRAKQGIPRTQEVVAINQARQLGSTLTANQSSSPAFVSPQAQDSPQSFVYIGPKTYDRPPVRDKFLAILCSLFMMGVVARALFGPRIVSRNHKGISN